MLSESEVQEIVARQCPTDSYRGRKVLLIIPAGTRTAPNGLMFRT
jgi:hypothetical protein